VGVSPKLYARIARFEAALESKALSTSDSWTDVAHHLGYFDQMHLIHDFKEFSGDIPTNLLTL
jgi:methylphosphotriester-DNA--protein-cysteine methyltransferase